jgi:hypothetical protein
LGTVILRQIRPEDANSEASFVRGLSPESRYLRSVVDRARSKGLRRMHGEVLVENRKMLALCRDLGLTARPSTEDAMVRTVTLDLVAPTLLSPPTVAGASIRA